MRWQRTLEQRHENVALQVVVATHPFTPLPVFFGIEVGVHHITDRQVTHSVRISLRIDRASRMFGCAQLETQTAVPWHSLPVESLLWALAQARTRSHRRSWSGCQRPAHPNFARARVLGEDVFRYQSLAALLRIRPDKSLRALCVAA